MSRPGRTGSVGNITHNGFTVNDPEAVQMYQSGQHVYSYVMEDNKMFAPKYEHLSGLSEEVEEMRDMTQMKYDHSIYQGDNMMQGIEMGGDLQYYNVQMMQEDLLHTDEEGDLINHILENESDKLPGYELAPEPTQQGAPSRMIPHASTTMAEPTRINQSPSTSMQSVVSNRVYPVGPMNREPTTNEQENIVVHVPEDFVKGGKTVQVMQHPDGGFMISFEDLQEDKQQPQLQLPQFEGSQNQRQQQIEHSGQRFRPQTQFIDENDITEEGDQMVQVVTVADDGTLVATEGQMTLAQAAQLGFLSQGGTVFAADEEFQEYCVNSDMSQVPSTSKAQVQVSSTSDEYVQYLEVDPSCFPAGYPANVQFVVDSSFDSSASTSSPSGATYVNQKQYARILKRREARAKLVASGRIPRIRSQKYLHESRHLHAVNRVRGNGGKFDRNPPGGQATCSPSAPSSSSAPSTSPATVTPSPEKKIYPPVRARNPTPLNAKVKTEDSKLKAVISHQPLPAKTKQNIVPRGFRAARPSEIKALPPLPTTYARAGSARMSTQPEPLPEKILSDSREGTAVPSGSSSPTSEFECADSKYSIFSGTDQTHF